MYEIRIVLNEVKSTGKRGRKSTKLISMLYDKRVALYDSGTAAVCKYEEAVEAAERICS